ncbi:helix-turn-helix domain protein [Mycobacterium kansasii 732]|nr:helix-turn-helix domain protein [Mycobacterium kansasii 732]
MLTWEDDVEVHALRKRGWTISAIARHTGFDRKTVRKYLAGGGTPGVRARPGPDPFDPFVDYVTARLTEDPHLWPAPCSTNSRTWGSGCPIRA